MRLICTLNDPLYASKLAQYLTNNGIENQVESVTETDWGNPNYGTMIFRIWVYDEDDFPKALTLTSEFQNDPTNERFQSVVNTPPKESPKVTVEQPNFTRRTRSSGTLTSYILIFCTLLLMISSLTAPTVKKVPPGLPAMALATSETYKNLMYDYPLAYERADDLVARFGLKALEDPSTLPPEGQKLFQKAIETPYWHGFYDLILAHERSPEKAPIVIEGPLFEKIRQGEIWRIITPIFLHSDIFHLLFNMIWLAIIGKQIEQRLAGRRYIFFILITGAISNTAQYLMSGPAFMGFSGVLCAMLTFIWWRQRIAPWEGYQLDKSTMVFITFFILFMFGLQLVSFFLEAYTSVAFSIGIANTAHLVGAAMGLILARMETFAWK